jgi:anti-sigma factor RsiW
MTHCDELRDALAAEIAGECEPDTRPALAAHLDGCPACAAERDRLRGALAILRAEEVPDPGALYWASFDARLRARIDAARTGARRRGRVLAAAAVLATCAIGLGVMLRQAGRPLGSPGAPGGRPAAPAADTGAEARLEAALRDLRGGDATGTAGALEAILDDVAPGDPFALAGGLDDIDNESGADSGNGGREVVR